MMTSIQGRKQRRALVNAPMHKRSKEMHAHLSKKLRERLGVSRRSMLIHKGDRVRLRRGDDAGKEGVVMEVDLSDRVVYVEGVVSKTAKGMEKLRAVRLPSIEIIDGDFTNKNRKAILDRSKKVQAKAKPAPPAN